MVDTLPAERSLTFHGPINISITNKFRSALCTMVNEGAQKITILFASGGGSTEDGMALHAFIKALPVEITMHAVGIVSSIAIPVFLATQNRLANEAAHFYFHEFNWTHERPTTVTQSTMTEQSMLLDIAMNWTKQVVKAATKLTDDDFQTMHLFDHPVAIDARSAVRWGIVKAIEEAKISAGSQPRIVVQ